MDPTVMWWTFFVLSAFIGVAVIAKVSSSRHTPLLSGTTTLHGIVLLAAITVTGTTENTFAVIVGLVAIVLATVNLVGGFVLTDRLLKALTGRSGSAPRARGER